MRIFTQARERPLRRHGHRRPIRAEEPRGRPQDATPHPRAKSRHRVSD